MPLADVRKAFSDVIDVGERHRLDCSRFQPADLDVAHFQGMVRWGDYLVYSYANYRPTGIWDAPRGLLVVASVPDKAVLSFVEVPGWDEDYTHPGGMQLIGDVLVVPLETSNYEHSRILFYDVRAVIESPASAQPLDDLTIERPKTGTGAAGVTDWFDKEREQLYVFAAYDNGNFVLYTAPDTFFGPAHEPPEKHDRVTLPHDDYSSIQLLTDTGGQKWMIGFRGKNRGDNWADLYTFSAFTKPEPTLQSSRPFAYELGEAVMGGFRFAAGMHIEPEANELTIYAGDRNPIFLADHLHYNRFKGSQGNIGP